MRPNAANGNLSCEVDGSAVLALRFMQMIARHRTLLELTAIAQLLGFFNYLANMVIPNVLFSLHIYRLKR